MSSWSALLGQGTQIMINQVIEKLGWKVISAIVAIVIAIFGLPLVFHSTVADVQVRNLIFSNLQTADDLTAVTMDAKATIRVEKPSDFLGWQVGQTNFVYEGVSKVQAGINLKQLDVKSVNPKSHQIHLVLPAPYLREGGLDVGRSSILANYHEWFASDATPEIQEEAQLKAMAAIRQEACDNQILEAASNSAKQLLTDVLTKVGYTTIQIDTQLPKDNPCAATKSA